jgi:hypothetical protein
MQLKENAERTREDILASTKGWRCLREKQNFAEAHFFKIPDAWLNPSIEYVNPPFTEDELNQEDAVADEAMKRDLQEFRKIYSEQFVKNNISNINLATADAPEVGYQRINKSLKLQISKLREFKPESTKIASLKTQLAYSLSQLEQSNSESIKLLNESSKIMALSNMLLTKPKEEIRAHKEELLLNQKELNTILYQLKKYSCKARRVKQRND